jgi:FkbM family methyltransferase
MISAKNLVRAWIPRSTRNWLRSPGKSIQWAWDGVRNNVGANRTIQLRPNWNVRCHPAVCRFVIENQNADPEQAAEFDAFIANSFSDMVFFDIGAHFGIFSLAAFHYGGRKAKVVSVDPSPVACRIMNIQAKLNGLSSRMSIIQASVGEQDGWQDMVAVGVLSAGYLVAPSDDHSSGELTRTKAVTLDQLSRDFKLVPTHVKIDVEGSEAEVLRGGCDLLSRDDAPLVFLELHNQMIRDRNENPEDTLLLLKKFGYEIFAMDNRPIYKDEILSKPIVRVIAKKV